MTVRKLEAGSRTQNVALRRRTRSTRRHAMTQRVYNAGFHVALRSDCFQRTASSLVPTRAAPAKEMCRQLKHGKGLER